MAKGNVLFDFLNEIMLGKQNLIQSGIGEKVYPAYMVNRGLSQHLDTVIYANQMNKYPQLDAKLQHDYLLHAIPRRKRYSKWAKKVDPNNIDAIRQYYQCSYDKARVILDVLDEADVKEIKLKLASVGGIKK